MDNPPFFLDNFSFCHFCRKGKNGVPNMAHERKGKNVEGLVGRPARLVSLVEYQDGSVVSREIVSGKAGTVTLFAFDEGQSLSEHRTPFDAMVQILDGEAEITIAGKPLQLSQGDIVIMPANKPHALKALTKFKMILTMIRSSHEAEDDE
jgi:quercetin dioxygenase-like cupin family protein